MVFQPPDIFWSRPNETTFLRPQQRSFVDGGVAVVRSKIFLGICSGVGSDIWFAEHCLLHHKSLSLYQRLQSTWSLRLKRWFKVTFTLCLIHSCIEAGHLSLSLPRDKVVVSILYLRIEKAGSDFSLNDRICQVENWISRTPTNARNAITNVIQLSPNSYLATPHGQLVCFKRMKCANRSTSKEKPDTATNKNLR